VAAGVRAGLGQHAHGDLAAGSPQISRRRPVSPLRLALFAGVLDTIANVAMLLAVQLSAAVIGCGLDVVVSGRDGWRWVCGVLERVTAGRPSASCWRLLAVGMIATG